MTVTGTAVAATATAAESRPRTILEGERAQGDISGPGAIVALCLLYLASDDAAVARQVGLPPSRYELLQLRPDQVLLRALTQPLILWDAVRPTDAWLLSALPAVLQSVYVEEWGRETAVRDGDGDDSRAHHRRRRGDDSRLWGGVADVDGAGSVRAVSGCGIAVRRHRRRRRPALAHRARAAVLAARSASAGRFIGSAAAGDEHRCGGHGGGVGGSRHRLLAGVAAVAAAAGASPCRSRFRQPPGGAHGHRPAVPRRRHGDVEHSAREPPAGVSASVRVGDGVALSGDARCGHRHAVPCAGGAVAAAGRVGRFCRAPSGGGGHAVSVAGVVVHRTPVSALAALLATGAAVGSGERRRRRRRRPSPPPPPPPGTPTVFTGTCRCGARGTAHPVCEAAGGPSAVSAGQARHQGHSGASVTGWRRQGADDVGDVDAGRGGDAVVLHRPAGDRWVRYGDGARGATPSASDDPVTAFYRSVLYDCLACDKPEVLPLYVQMECCVRGALTAGETVGVQNVQLMESFGSSGWRQVLQWPLLVQPRYLAEWWCRLLQALGVDAAMEAERGAEGVVDALRPWWQRGPRVWLRYGEDIAAGRGGGSCRAACRRLALLLRSLDISTSATDIPSARQCIASSPSILAADAVFIALQADRPATTVTAYRRPTLALLRHLFPCSTSSPTPR
eukprot:ctg_2019.g317